MTGRVAFCPGFQRVFPRDFSCGWEENRRQKRKVAPERRTEAHKMRLRLRQGRLLQRNGIYVPAEALTVRPE